MRWLALLAVTACGGGPGAAPDAAVPERALGMSDLSILVPLPSDPATPVLGSLPGDGTPLVWDGLFDGLVLAREDIAPKNGLTFGFADMQIVAVRFDVCDRAVAGPCPAGVDGRLRLVLQPMYTQGSAVLAHDVAIHALYPVPAAELADVVHELRALAALGGTPPDAPLTVSPPLAAGDAAYLAQLRALVLRYARWDRLARLTVIGQESNSGAFAWILRGFDHVPGGSPYAFASIPIAQVNATKQTVLAAGGDTTYLTEPEADLPSGLALAFAGEAFDAAPPDQQATALAALVEAQNPALHDANDLQCAACHVSTYLTAARAAHLGADPTALPVAFRSPHELAVSSIATQDPRVIRAFGWVASSPAISQRVANDTAHALADLDALFPAR